MSDVENRFGASRIDLAAMKISDVPPVEISDDESDEAPPKRTLRGPFIYHRGGAGELALADAGAQNRKIQRIRTGVEHFFDLLDVDAGGIDAEVTSKAANPQSLFPEILNKSKQSPVAAPRLVGVVDFAASTQMIERKDPSKTGSLSPNQETFATERVATLATSLDLWLNTISTNPDDDYTDADVRKMRDELVELLALQKLLQGDRPIETEKGMPQPSSKGPPTSYDEEDLFQISDEDLVPQAGAQFDPAADDDRVLDQLVSPARRIVEVASVVPVQPEIVDEDSLDEIEPDDEEEEVVATPEDVDQQDSEGDEKEEDSEEAVIEPVISVVKAGSDASVSDDQAIARFKRLNTDEMPVYTASDLEPLDDDSKEPGKASVKAVEMTQEGERSLASEADGVEVIPEDALAPVDEENTPTEPASRRVEAVRQEEAPAVQNEPVSMGSMPRKAATRLGQWFKHSFNSKSEPKHPDSSN